MCPPLPFSIFKFKRQNTKKGIKFCREIKNRITEERRTCEMTRGICVVFLSEELEELGQLPIVHIILEAME